ncbi:hypothetical protein B7P43_G09916 [Cryptotermes secundus]|uniref:Mos1 transposase HTH domain-containing protein n=1 Tax=Cryptotermes secundus TaxID=105785 RepID=A0A2J7RDI7_9NEOP|nr:hypothetical protein B7P43_G09916 [Cryptotermes secundus]
MADLREQRVCIKFCFKLGKTAAETHQMLKQAFGENSLGQTQTYNWYKRFKNGQTLTDDDNRSGRPLTGKTPENVAKDRDLVLQDHQLIIEDLSNTLGLSYGTCQQILSEELNMRRIAMKFVPQLLQNEQKQHRLEICRELQQQLQEDPNFRRLPLVTKVGFMATTLKASSYRCNGRVLLHLGQKKLDKSRATLSPCSVFLY